MKETREEIRARLLREDSVLKTIQMRAYEIWQLRGRYDGRAKEDWLLAENEVLGFLTEQELRKADFEEPTISEIIVVEEVATPKQILETRIEDEPVVVESEIAVAAVEITPETIAEMPITSETPLAPPEKKTRKRATTTSAAKTTKAAKPAAKKTTSRKKETTAEVESETKAETKTEEESAPKKAAPKRTASRATTKKTAKSQPSAE